MVFQFEGVPLRVSQGLPCSTPATGSCLAWGQQGVAAQRRPPASADHFFSSFDLAQGKHRPYMWEWKSEFPANVLLLFLGRNTIGLLGVLNSTRILSYLFWPRKKIGTSIGTLFPSFSLKIPPCQGIEDVALILVGAKMNPADETGRQVVGSPNSPSAASWGCTNLGS